MTIAQADEQVDVRYDQRRFITDHSRLAYVPRNRFTDHIPFTGDPDLFLGTVTAGLARI